MQEQIKELLGRYIKGECTEQEMALLESWFDRLAVDESKGRLLNAGDEKRLVMELWKAVAAREEAGGETAEGESEEEPEAGGGRVRAMRSRRIVRIAAMWVGLLLLAGAIWMQINRMKPTGDAKKQPTYIEVATGYQQVHKILLPDSSIVWLNSATHLAFDSDFLNHREVRLSGEAFFDVRSDVRHPFVVRAGGVSTQVFGTSFNVSAYAEAGEMRVSLKTGKVGVSYGNNARQLLTPGELLVCDKTSGAERVIRQAPAEMNVWTLGSLLFYETPLKEALAQIEARYGVHFLYQHPLKNTKTVTARFENTALDKVLEGLAFGWDLRFTRHGDSLQVRSR
jgi:transmembrane sensor